MDAFKSFGLASAFNTSTDQLTDSRRILVRDAVIDCISTMWIFYTCMLFVGLLASLCIGRTELCKRYEEHKAGLGTEEANQIADEKGNRCGERKGLASIPACQEDIVSVHTSWGSLSLSLSLSLSFIC